MLRPKRYSLFCDVWGNDKILFILLLLLVSSRKIVIMIRCVAGHSPAAAAQPSRPPAPFLRSLLSVHLHV